MKSNEEHDLATQVALLTQKIGDMAESMAKLERKLDAIMEKYETKFATKEELQEVKDDVKEVRESNSKFILWLLGVSVTALISILLTFIK